jgi:DNA-binding FadR family transcriptional regulator
VVDSLVGRIVSGRYAAGELLPKEELLVEEFDISRGTVREALRALEERRVVVVKHGRGARVQPLAEWDVLDPVVARALAAGRRRREFLDEFRVCRLSLESEAAGLAAERASEAQRTELRTMSEELAQAPDVSLAVRNVRRLIAISSGNRPLASMLRALDDAIEPRVGRSEAQMCARLGLAVADGDAGAARDATRALNAA